MYSIDELKKILDVCYDNNVIVYDSMAMGGEISWGLIARIKQVFKRYYKKLPQCIYMSSLAKFALEVEVLRIQQDNYIYRNRLKDLEEIIVEEDELEHGYELEEYFTKTKQALLPYSDIEFIIAIGDNNTEVLVGSY